MANNIVLNPQRGDQIALTGVSSAYSQPSAFQPIGVTTYSTASIPANANNALLGKALTISGFAAAGNNGTFLVVSSTATSITVSSGTGVVVVAAGLATFQTQGNPAQYASKIENNWSNQNGDNVVVNANAGDCLVAIAIGMRSYDPFDLLHGSAPYPVAGGGGNTIPFGFTQGLNDFNAAPTISDLAGGASVSIVATSVTSNVITVQYTNPGTATYFAVSQSVILTNTQEAAVNGQTVVVATVGQVEGDKWQFTAPLTTANYSNPDDTGDATPAGNAWTLAESISIADSDYTVSATPPTAPNPFPSSKWNLDGYYPSIYVWTAANVAAGSYNVNLNSMFQPGDANNLTDWASGARPIFDGGVNFMVFNLSGAATSAVVEASSISSGSPAETTSNPATAPSTLVVANADGDALISIGLMKMSNAMAVGTVNVTAGAASGAAMQQIGSGKLVGGEAHYLVGYGLVATGTWNPNFSNPLGYPMLIGTLAIKSS